MVIKVCGLRAPENIHDVQHLDVDWLGFVFVKDSPRYVKQISSHAGIIPDYSSLKEDAMSEEENRRKPVKRVGVFMDDMPQNIVTRVVNYRLDIVQLHGEESPVMMENLRRTLDPDISAGIKLIKTIYIEHADDIKKTADYSQTADYFLFEPKAVSKTDGTGDFDWNLLSSYDGDIPFLIGGDIGLNDVERIRQFKHPRFYGINVNSCFEVEYAVKDVRSLRTFVERVKGKIE